MLPKSFMKPDEARSAGRVQRLEEYGRMMLLFSMRGISEDAFDAQWIHFHAIALWKVVVSGGGQYGDLGISENDARYLLRMAEDVGGWWRHNPVTGEKDFVPMDEWRQFVGGVERREYGG